MKTFVKLFGRQLSEKKKEILQNFAFPEDPIKLLKSHRPVLDHMLFSKSIIGKKNEINTIELEQYFGE